MKHPHYDIALWYFSDPENNKVQYYVAPAHDWRDIENPSFKTDIKYRRKPPPPKRITINGVEINAPLSEEPGIGTERWFFGTANAIFADFWDGATWQKRDLADGRCFATEQDAQAAYDAITLALTRGKQ